jgi:hypothetical protein
LEDDSRLLPHDDIDGEERIGGMFNEVNGDNKINNENMYDEEKEGIVLCNEDAID